MAAMQAEDVRASFLFVGNLNGYDQEWLGSMTKNRHGVADLTSWPCLVVISWLLAQAMHMVELNLRMTDVPNLVQVAIVGP